MAIDTEAEYERLRTVLKFEHPDELIEEVRTLRRELEEAEHQRDKALDSVEKLLLMHAEQPREQETALACCNAFLDADSLDKLMFTGYDHIKRLALKATGRDE